MKISVAFRVGVFVAISALLVGVTPLHAATQDKTPFDVHSGDLVYLAEGEEYNAVFFGAGGHIDLNGTINDDVFVFGANIEISGTVNGDVFAFGSAITIDGTINGDLRGAGSTIRIDGPIAGNMMMAGAVITVTPEAEVGRNVIVAAAQTNIEGAVAKNIHIAGASVVINGPVGGSVYARIGESNEEQGALILRENAQIAGNVEYTAPKILQQEGGTVGGILEYSQIKRTPKSQPQGYERVDTSRIFGGLYLAFSFISMLGLILVGLVFIHLMGKFNSRVQKRLEKNVGSTWLSGMLSVIGVPILLIIIAITIIGAPLALIGGAVYMITVYLASVVSAIWVGNTVIFYMRNKKDRAKAINQKTAVIVGGVVLSVLLAMPLVGWLLKLFVLGVGVGALVDTARTDLEKA